MKRRRQSLTYLVNAIVIALAGAEAQLDIIQAKLGVDVYVWISFALPIVNMILREFTGVPVSPIGRRRASRSMSAREDVDHDYYERGA